MIDDIGRHRTEELAVAEWGRIMVINAKGVFLCRKAAIPLLKM